MRRIISVIVSAVLVAGFVSCSVKPDEAAENISLVNRMTQEELARADKHAFTLLDAPEVSDPLADFESADHTVQFTMTEMTPDGMRSQLDASRDQMTEDEYNEALEWIEQHPEGVTYPTGCFFDGYVLFDMIPLLGYSEGDEIVFSIAADDENGQPGASEEIRLANVNEYLDWVRQKHIDDGESEAKASIAASRVRIAYEALQSGDYEVMSGDIDYSDPSIWEPNDLDMDYRSEWEYDRAEVEAISDSVDEYSIYDEEMDIEFLVHATLPPDYDPAKTYPVFFMTDGVYRFGNHPALRKAMENGEASGVILVSLGYNYHMNGREEENRFEHMVIERSKLLDFITDNLMPYLGEQYNIDYASSSLYGHSDGGVFTHYALFNSDLYENQPFGRYIIGSPAFFALYDDPEELDLDGYQNDYGYWDRNSALDKKVFLSGGSQEDPDYADLYHGNETILEGLASLKSRLESHGADFVYRLYDSHHYQYIPDMLLEYLKENYPAVGG